MAFEPFLAYEASAGSGKTFNLVVRYLSLLFMGEDPGSIVALTFTNKAANEMLERIVTTLIHLEERGELDAIAAICGMEKSEILSRRHGVLKQFLHSDVQISTIDKFFGRILRKFALNAGLMPTFKTVQNHHEVKLLQRFLNEAEVSDASDALVRLSLLSDKRLHDLFVLLSGLYAKHKEFDLDAYEDAAIPEESTARAMELANELAALMLSKPLSDRAKATMMFDSFESLLGKTWLLRPSLEYWDFKKHYVPQMDDLLRALQDAVATQMQRRETLYFKELFAVLKLYLKTRRTMAVQSNELSFDDITLNVHELLRGKLESEFLYFRLDSRIKHLLLDEFQDTSVMQFDILRPLIEEIRSGVGINEGGSFFFVGDVKQSIYRFRGGVSALFYQVAEHFDVRIEPLKVNYRSRSVIVDFVNATFGGKIAGYIPQESPRALEGGFVQVHISETPMEQMAERVSSLIQNGVSPDGIAVLTLTNKDGATVEEYLSALGHAVVTETTSRLVSQRSVRAVIEYLRYCYFDAAIYRLNCAALVGVSPDEIGRNAVHDPVAGAVDFIRRHNLADKSALLFVEALGGYRDIEEVVYEIDRLESASPQSDLHGIRIMTVHKSKGLEFEHVIVLDQLGKPRPKSDPIVFEYDGVRLSGLHYRIKNREMLDPHYALALEKTKKASEEDRLNALYVALTRAVESLTIIAKPKESWFEPLELSEGERGRMLSHSQAPQRPSAPPAIRYLAQKFGTQEEKESTHKEATHDFWAVQFGLALHHTLEVAADFDEISISQALESARNRYGAMLPGGIEEIRKRVMRLIDDPTFTVLTRGERYKEQMIRHRGSIGIIDLLVRNDDGWVVIDYKSGREEEDKHRMQVRTYCDAIRAFGSEPVRGYLCYLLSEGTEWVECL